MEWRFEGREVTVRFADASLPRQFFLAANNWFLTSMEAFTDKAREERIADLIRGLPEFEETEAGNEAQVLIKEEVDLKLKIYFDVILDKSVSAGTYAFAEFMSVYRLLLTKALYHRYHSRINGSHGIISMPLDQLPRDLEESDPSINALQRLGVHLTRLVEDFLGARLPNTDEQRLLQLPSGVPVTRNIRTAYAGEQPVEVLDTISNGEVVSYRFEIKV